MVAVIMSLRTDDASFSFRLCTGIECPPWNRSSISPSLESLFRKAVACSMLVKNRALIAEHNEAFNKDGEVSGVRDGFGIGFGSGQRRGPSGF